MAGQATRYADKAYLEWLVGKTAMPAVGSIYVALLTAAPTEPINGGTITEATYTNYARKSTAGADWAAATDGPPAAITNANAITFAACGGGSSAVTHFCLIDSANGAGNVRTWGSLSSTQTISGTATPSFAAGALSATAA